MSDPLVSRLRDLGEHVDWATGDVSEVVTRRLTRAPSRTNRRWQAVAIAVLTVIVGTALPAGRAVVADLLGVVGIEVEWADRLPPASGSLDLGRVVSLQEAQESLDFTLALPTADPPGPPDQVFLDEGRLATVWSASSDLPEVVDTGIGLLHIQFRATLDQAVLTKQVLQEAAIREVPVRGRFGIWIEDGPHAVTHLDLDGRERSETTRLAGNVLMWEEDGVTHRLESGLSLDRALAIAESLDPP